MQQKMKASIILTTRLVVAVGGLSPSPGPFSIIDHSPINHKSIEAIPGEHKTHFLFKKHPINENFRATWNKYQHLANFQGRTLHLHVLAVTITTHAYGLTTTTLYANQCTTGSGITIPYPTRQASSQKEISRKLGKKDARMEARSSASAHRVSCTHARLHLWMKINVKSQKISIWGA